ncbi:MAG TPA: YggS family pyridoxal phosphate-dependent enzyme [Phycisphaerae bacterium]|nr:YggS family pyridoxal phosphate-dependent enzyme [Phycisphaerae bacterium]
MRRKLSDNIKRVRDRIAHACQRAGRRPEDVRLVAVTKMIEIDVIRTALDMGLEDLGENRVQELIRRAIMLNEYVTRRRRMEPGREVSEPHWHMIGHVQRNKVRPLLPWAHTVHSVDSLRLAEEISAEAVRIGRVVPAMVEVNVSGEKSKFGIAVGAVSHVVEHIIPLPGLRIVGLMTMAPLDDNAEQARPHFARLRDIFEEMKIERIVGPEFRELSMGMSSDYEVAIEEGATTIRIGRALFEGVV